VHYSLDCSRQSFLSSDSYGAHQDLHSFPTRRSSDLPTLHHQVTSRCLIRSNSNGSWMPTYRYCVRYRLAMFPAASTRPCPSARRSEEHTSELQSRENLVCRLLLEKKKDEER